MIRTAQTAGDLTFAGQGEIRSLCRLLDWRSTSLGDVHSWSESLRTAVRICLDASSTPMAVFAGSDHVLIYNERYASLLGPANHPRALGRPASEVWPEFWERLGPRLRRLTEHGEPDDTDEQAFAPVRDDGSSEPFASFRSLTRVRGEHGQVIGVLDVIHEATPALHAGEAIARQHRPELEALYETAPIGLCVFDEHLRWVRVNKVIAEINGKSIEEHIGKTPSEIVPDVGAQAEQALREILRTGERLDFEMHGTTSAQPGVQRTWSEHWVPIKSPAGAIVAISVAAEEITDRKRAAEALAESEERFRTLADNIAQFAWMADHTGSIVWYNKRWYDYTGTRPDEMLGWGWQRVHHPDHVARVVEKIRDCFDTGQPWEDSFPLRGKNGEYRWFLSRAVPIRDDAGSVVRWFGTNTDVTEQRAAEDALRQSEAALREADRHKSEFLAWLSHELRNPLGVARGSLALIQRAGLDSQHAKRALPVVDRQLAHMARLLDDLLDLTRIAKGKILLNRGSCELNEIVRIAAEDFRQVFEAQGINFELALPETPMRSCVDRTRIEQVIGNLLQNAAKFTPRGGHVSLSLHPSQNGEAVFTVQDDGAGLSAEMLGSVFDALVQDSRTLDRSQGGLGLGLALVKELVQLHGGRVKASSDGPGRGATFTVWLPL